MSPNLQSPVLPPPDLQQQIKDLQLQLGRHCCDGEFEKAVLASEQLIQLEQGNASSKETQLSRDSLTRAVSASAASRAKIASAYRFLAQGMECMSRGDFSASQKAFEASASLFESELGREDLATVNSLLKVGTIRNVTGGSVGANATAEDLIQRTETLFGQAHPRYAEALALLGNCRMKMKDFKSAEQHFQKSLAIREAAFGDTSDLYTRSLNHLGRLYLEQGEPELAIAYFDRARVNSMIGDIPPRTAIETTALRGRGYFDMRRYETAEKLLRQALTEWQAIGYEKLPDFKVTMGVHAESLRKLQRHVEADVVDARIKELFPSE